MVPTDHAALGHALFRPQGDQIVLIEQRGAWSHKAHIALDDAPQLR